MSEDATIEDEPELEQSGHSSRPETKSGLLPWSYILEMVTKQWAIFLIVSLAIGIYLYINGRRRTSEKRSSSAIRQDHIQSGSTTKTTPRKIRKMD